MSDRQFPSPNQARRDRMRSVVNKLRSGEWSIAVGYFDSGRSHHGLMDAVSSSENDAIQKVLQTALVVWCESRM